MMMPCALLLLPVATSAAVDCSSGFADMWASIPVGENAYVIEMKDGVTPERPQGDSGLSFFSYCLPKGEDGSVLNPFIETKLHKSM